MRLPIRSPAIARLRCVRQFDNGVYPQMIPPDPDDPFPPPDIPPTMFCGALCDITDNRDSCRSFCDGLPPEDKLECENGCELAYFACLEDCVN